MAVITKYVVVRQGVELDREFLVKKEADAYDKMLDAAENLASYIKEAGLEIAVADATIEAIAVFLAQNGPEVARILKGLKPAKPAAARASEGDSQTTVPPKPAPKKKAAPAQPNRK
jgi:dsDNA-binding SOS-regulon protein